MIHWAAIRSLLLGRALGIPARICYAPSPDGLKACAREQGHGADVPHNARHDGSGEGWG